MADKFKHAYCPVCETGRAGSFCALCGTPLLEGIRRCDCGYDDIWTHEKFCRECGCPASPLPKKEASQCV